MHRKRASIGVRAFAAASAAGFGLLGWTVAHALSTWLLDHCHVPGSAPSSDLRAHAAEAALLYACLAAGSLLAMLAVARGSRERTSKRSLRLAALLSSVAFVCSDFAERAVAGEHAVPSFMVLLIGIAVYALAGAGTTLLWRRCADAVVAVLSLFDAGTERCAVVRFAAAGGHGAGARRRAERVGAGRSPPVWA